MEEVKDEEEHGSTVGSCVGAFLAPQRKKKVKKNFPQEAFCEECWYEGQRLGLRCLLKRARSERLNSRASSRNARH